MHAQFYEFLKSRRSASAKNLAEPGPDHATLETILSAAAHAPDHGLLVPFRFISIQDRAAFADVLEAATREESAAASASEIDRSREKAFQGPALVAIVARIDANHPKIQASDQWLTVGCALENLLLAVQAMGFQAAVRSGRYLETRAVRSAFALADNETLVSYVAIGTAVEMPPVKPKPRLGDIWTVWAG